MSEEETQQDPKAVYATKFLEIADKYELRGVQLRREGTMIIMSAADVHSKADDIRAALDEICALEKP